MALAYTFIKGLDHNINILLYSVTYGQVMGKNDDELYALHNWILQGNLKWQVDVSRSMGEKSCRYNRGR